MGHSIWWHIGYGERKAEKAVAKLPVVAIVGVSYAGQYAKHVVHEMREGRAAASEVPAPAVQAEAHLAMVREGIVAQATA